MKPLARRSHLVCFIYDDFTAVQALYASEIFRSILFVLFGLKGFYSRTVEILILGGGRGCLRLARGAGWIKVCFSLVCIFSAFRSDRFCPRKIGKNERFSDQIALHFTPSRGRKSWVQSGVRLPFPGHDGSVSLFLLCAEGRLFYAIGRVTAWQFAF